MEDNNAGAKFIYFLAGIGIGALAGILFAPQSGEDTRDYLTGRAEEGRDYIKGKGQQIRSQATDYIDRGRSVLNQQRDNLSAAIEAGKQAYRAENQGKAASE